MTKINYFIEKLMGIKVENYGNQAALISKILNQ